MPETPARKVHLAAVRQPRDHHVGFQELGALVEGNASQVQGVVREEAELLVIQDADAAQDALEVRRRVLPVATFQVLAAEVADGSTSSPTTSSSRCRRCLNLLLSNSAGDRYPRAECQRLWL